MAVAHSLTFQKLRWAFVACGLAWAGLQAYIINGFGFEWYTALTDSLVRKRVLNDIANADSSIAIASMIPGDFDEAAKLRVANKKLYLINSDVTPTDSAGFVSNKISYSIKYIHGSGHYPMIEQPAAFNAALEEILADIKKRPVQ